MWPFSFKEPLFQWTISVKGYFEASPKRTTHTSYVSERECLRRDLFLSAGSDFDRAMDKSSSFLFLSFPCLLTLFRFRKTWWNRYIQRPKDYNFFVQSPTSTVLNTLCWVSYCINYMSDTYKTPQSFLNTSLALFVKTISWMLRLKTSETDNILFALS